MIFKRAVIVSLLGHIILLSIFSLSFGNKLEKKVYTEVSSFGAILKSYDLSFADKFKLIIPRVSRQQGENVFSLPAEEKVSVGRDFADYYRKPPVNLILDNEKKAFTQNLSEISFYRKKKESVVVFYPTMPYYFNLYFRDRQIVHIELEYSLISRDKTDSIIIKRKISSGNLDVDLLCMRYIDHYLSIQQDRLIPNERQVVKIDLELKK
ncbi:MAG: hypothetical protein V2A64_02330 [Candidatus Omnitrophota bacterium]